MYNIWKTMTNKSIYHYLKIVVFIFLVIPITHAAAAQAPDFELPTDTGKINLSDLKNKVVYLDFWSSWCDPCRKSFLWMDEMQRRYGENGLVVVAVNLDKDRALANKFLKKIPVKFTIAYDPEGVLAEKYDVRGMPSSYIISREGELVKTNIGFRVEDALEVENQLRLSLEH